MGITLDHTEGNELSWSDASPAKGVTSTADIDAGDGAFFEYVNVGLSIDMDANIDGSGVDVKVVYTPDSKTTMPDTNTTIFNVAAAEATPIYQLQLQRFNFAQIQVLNNTTTEGEVTPIGFWEGCKVTDS